MILSVPLTFTSTKMFHALKLYTIFLYLLEPAAVAAKGPLGNPRNCIPLCELLSRLGRRHLHLHPIRQAGCPSLKNRFSSPVH